MTRMVESYAAGTWFTADDEGTVVRDAVTGDEVARVSSRGVDVNALVAHGREQGGPALRRLTFHDRAAILKTLAQTLDEHKEELYALSAHTGATLADSRIDIDGGIGTLYSYASKGKRDLPNERFVVDGGVESLGKRGTFVGQHLYVSRAGVAVQINAFNFPVWGMLEKLAPAFLAGVPSIVKPATPTAYLTEAAVRHVVDVVPEGSLQLMCGRPAGLLDALGGQDYVAFTGSASTAQRLRSLPAVVNRAVRFNAEADSLNCSILGPDAVEGTTEFDLFVDQLVLEMTVKAGQKCTAIRRALVPNGLADAVVAATVERLAKVVVGNPANPAVTMGALVSLEQREEVRRALKALTSSATVVFGDPDHVEPVDANAETGAFMSPILLRTNDPEAAEIHHVEAFGPVSTVLEYDNVNHALALAARGEGSLVGSIVSHDPDVVRPLVRGVARTPARARP
jgi:oxepin-CoA hydrolase / 3-oxo-5,6-dehydrosuberyl-CoA semialdehyde dehydrogenase